MLQEPNPGKKKGLGKQVAGFKKSVQENAVERILFWELCTKFDQKPECAGFLKKTGEKRLYLTSPHDTLLWSRTEYIQYGY